MISEIIYSIHYFDGKIIINGELGKREYTGLTKREAKTAYMNEYNGKIFVAM